MRLIVKGSSSKGNGYLLKAEDGNSIIIECGLPLSAFINADTPLSSIQGAIISHCHGDHSKRTDDYLRAAVDVYMHPETEALVRQKWIKYSTTFSIRNFSDEIPFSIGRFDIMPFRLFHDVPCHGFLIRHPEMQGNLLFCTDTKRIPYTFDDVRCLMVETDYDAVLLAENEYNGITHPSNGRRIRQTHYSIDDAISFCSNRDISKVDKIIMLHLSDNNADRETFLQRMIEATGRLVYVAQPGLDISVGDRPF